MGLGRICVCLRVYTHVRIYMYVIKINEKRNYEFEREQRGR